MIEKELEKLLNEASIIRKRNIEDHEASFYKDVFDELSKFILKKTNNIFFRKRSIKIIAQHFDEILPYIVSSNNDILLQNIKELVECMEFKEKFIKGLKNYPYKDGFSVIFYNIWVCLHDDDTKYNNFLNGEILTLLATFNLSNMFYAELLDNLNELNQKTLLFNLAENNVDIPYSSFTYKGNNKQMIYDNIDFFMKNAKNLYSLMKFVKNDEKSLKTVKEYIDHNESQAINSLYCGTENLIQITDETIQELIRLAVLDVMKNEHEKLSNITYTSGGYSRVILLGDKVIKIGNRETQQIPNNPYIIAPLLRQEFKSNNAKCFVEITERVDTSNPPSNEELYQLYKNLRKLGLVWTDVKASNVGRLKKENIIHWEEDLKPSEEVLGLLGKSGNTILQEGDLVLLDADFIFYENDPNIIKTDSYLYKDFEKRYQIEIQKLETTESLPDETFNESGDLEKTIHR